MEVIVKKNIPNEIIEYIIEFIPFWEINENFDLFKSYYFPMSSFFIVDYDTECEFKDFLNNIVKQIDDHIDDNEYYNDYEDLEDVSNEVINDYVDDIEDWISDNIELSWLLKFHQDNNYSDLTTIFEDYEYYDVSIKKDLIRRVIFECLDIKLKNLKITNP